MIDFHTHILPNIDDGSKSVEETFNLIKEAERVGFDKIISTSHYMEDYYEVENKDRKLWTDALNQKLPEQNIDVKIYLGNEIYITENILDLLKNDKAATLNNSDYLLFETPLNAEPLNLYELVFKMLQDNKIPILAHPERYSFIHKNPEMLYDLVEKGVLLQCNFGSFVGQYGKTAKSIARDLLYKNMVHFLGSDVHRQNTIYPRIPEAIEEIKKIAGEEKLKELTETNPELVLQNKSINIEEPKHLKMSLSQKIKMKFK